jgi:hypothetical protein
MPKPNDAFMKELKAALPPYNDSILPALKSARRNPELNARFKATLALSKIFILRLNTSGQILAIPANLSGTKQDCAACFSSPHRAMLAWAKIVRTRDLKGVVPAVESADLHRFFADALATGFMIYLNYESLPDESYIFNREEIADFLFSLAPPSADQPTSAPPPHGRIQGREMRRSKQGREVISTIDSKKPIPEIDFDIPKTKYQMAAIFEVSENEISKQMADLDHKRILDLDSHRISLDESPKAPLYYDSLVLFHIGCQIDGARGEEFRRWFVELIYQFWRGKAADEAEIAALREEAASRSKTILGLEGEMREKGKTIEALQSAIKQLNQEISDQNRLMADLKNVPETAGAWDLLESTLETVMQARLAAAARFAATLVFHERVDRAIKDFSLNQNKTAAVAAARIFKALATNLYPAKFVKRSFSEEQFRAETGLEMSMTESKASKRDQAVWESRTCLYHDREITFFPHIKETIDGVEFRIHFQFLDDERKIIVCHAGEHLLNAQTKYMN